jgi:hypothetical protein
MGARNCLLRKGGVFVVLEIQAVPFSFVRRMAVAIIGLLKLGFSRLFCRISLVTSN